MNLPPGHFSSRKVPILPNFFLPFKIFLCLFSVLRPDCLFFVFRNNLEEWDYFLFVELEVSKGHVLSTCLVYYLEFPPGCQKS